MKRAIVIALISLNSCMKPFYDGEGNKIPIRVVRLQVKSQFIIVTPKEKRLIDRYFYFGRQRYR